MPKTPKREIDSLSQRLSILRDINEVFAQQIIDLKKRVSQLEDQLGVHLRGDDRSHSAFIDIPPPPPKVWMQREEYKPRQEGAE